MEYKRTKYVNRLIDRKNNGLIKVITGARRSGKSYLLNELFYSSLIAQGISKKNIIRFSFDSDEDIDLLDEYLKDTPSKIKSTNNEIEVNSKKFRAYIKDKTNENEDFYLFLDEIQILENFIGTLNGLLKHKNFDIYVTGSNSRFLSSDIATEFKGRGTIIHVLPLVFSEYVENTQQDITKAWKDYIVTGGIPLVANMQSDEEKNNYLKLLAEETYLKDIIQRHNLKKKNEIGDTFNILASTIGAPLNIRRITNTFKSVMNKDISELTISNFIDYFEDAFVISKAQKYNIKGRKYIGSPFKLYFEDVGVRNARLNFRQIEETHLMENIIYNELRYRGFNVDVGEVNVSEKTERTDVNGKNIYEQKKLEVDFVATKGNEKYYIQSALSMSDPEKQLQEKRSLYYIDDSFKKIVVSRTGLKPSFDEKGILVVDLFDFLLDERYMT
ncbi:ATP-binding protein [Succinivibrio sp.]|uniref:ATP-binding protein n=1 Tax=Succinivibrio sp. TaxID=2053619 RepID=UPI003867F879